MGVQSTTKTLKYTVGNNNVDGTFLSSAGFNGRYLGRIPGILKFFSLILCIISLALVASQREDMRLRKFIHDPDTGIVIPDQNNTMTHPKELFLSGEVYFLCAHTALLFFMTVLLMTYLFHTLSSMVVPKTSTVEMAMFFVLSLMIMAAGITEIVQTEKWKSDPEMPDKMLMTSQQEAIRDAAGALAVINALVLFAMYFVAKKEYDGPHHDMGGNLSSLQ